MKLVLFIQRIYRSPAVLGLSIGGLLLAGLFVQEYVLGRFAIIQVSDIALRDLRIAFVHCLLAGYLPSAYLYLTRGARDTFNELEEVLKPADDPSSVDSAVHLGSRALLVSGFAGVLLAVFFSYLTAVSPWDLSTWTPEIFWHRVLGPFIGWWWGWFILAIWRTSTLVSRLANRIGSIDLQDLSPLLPFVKHGLLAALLVVGAVSISSLFLFDPEQRQWIVVASVVGISLPLASVALWSPVRGVYRRIRQAKESELEWTRERIRQSRIILDDVYSEASPSQMADLIAYQKFIEDVPEWPLQVLSIVQVLLYLLIPIVSWIGGLLIENMLDYFFG